MGVSKNSGKTPKMDGENNGKPYEQMDDLGGNTPIFGSTPISSQVDRSKKQNARLPLLEESWHRLLQRKSEVFPQKKIPPELRLFKKHGISVGFC